MSIIEDNNFFTEDEKNNYNDFKFYYKIPLFFQNKAGSYGNSPTLTHTLVDRLENTSDIPDRACSDVNNLLFPILYKFTQKHNLPFKRILRGCINCTIPSVETMSEIHRDHLFDHYVFLMYINETFEGGKTFIYDDNKNIIRTIMPEAHKIVCFKGNYHSFEYPVKGMRFVVVYTFD
jgi:hypothetical protein